VIRKHPHVYFIFELFAQVWSKKGSHDINFNALPSIQGCIYCEQLCQKRGSHNCKNEIYIVMKNYSLFVNSLLES